MHHIAWVYHVKLLVVRDLFCLELGIRRRKALQAPFLVWDPLKASVAVRHDLFPPSSFSSLPLCPCFGCLLRDAVRNAQFALRIRRGALAEDQGLTCREREEEDPHSNGREGETGGIVQGTLLLETSHSVHD